MKLNVQAIVSIDRHFSWIAALWFALVLLAAGGVLSSIGGNPAAQAATVVAAAPAHRDAGIRPSDPEAPAASDQLALVP